MCRILAPNLNNKVVGYNFEKSTISCLLQCMDVCILVAKCSDMSSFSTLGNCEVLCSSFFAVRRLKEGKTTNSNGVYEHQQ